MKAADIRAVAEMASRLAQWQEFLKAMTPTSQVKLEFQVPDVQDKLNQRLGVGCGTRPFGTFVQSHVVRNMLLDQIADLKSQMRGLGVEFAEDKIES